MTPDPTSPDEFVSQEREGAIERHALGGVFRRAGAADFEDLKTGEGAGRKDLRSDDPTEYANREHQSKAAPRGWLLQMVITFSKNRLALVFFGLLVLIAAFSFLGPFFYHSNQTDPSRFLGILGCNNHAPTAQHILGRDPYCWDELGRLMVGGQSSLEVGFASAIISMIFGVFYGLFSGFRGGLIDAVMMRFLDVLLSIPGLFVLLVAFILFGHTKINLILVISITGWYGVARILRSDALSLREREYAQAVRAMGGGTRRIIGRHIIPNSISTTVTLGTFAIGDSILLLAAIGFLGLGLQSPQTDWGTMLSTSETAIILNYWWQLWPAVVLFLTVVMSFNYIGDALRDAFEVRLHER